ncbi:MAG: NAD(P)-dependent oxidoreductase [Vicinamibacterales bacterium]
MRTDAMREPVLVTGASGRLAGFVAAAFAGRRLVLAARRDLDITDAGAVRRMVAEVRPAVIVNCAAYNDVEQAEDAVEDALAVNAFGVRELARAAAGVQATLVHYSTDFVFDGEADRPYVEGDRTRPLSAYAASKWLGERFAQDAPGALVLRVESLFGCEPEWQGPLGSLDAMVARLRTGQDVRAFTDRVVTPSYMIDVALATRHLVDNRAAPGIYHCVNSGQETWDGVVNEAARTMGVTAKVVPITLADVAMRAARPRFCALSNAKLAATGLTMPTWQDAIHRWLAPQRAAGAPA